MTKQSVAEIITNDVVAALESGVAPWAKDWDTKGFSGLPKNQKSGNVYKGINTLMTLMHQRAFSLRGGAYITFKQAQEKGWHLEAGHKGEGVRIVFFNIKETTDRATGEIKSIPFMRYSTAFPVDWFQDEAGNPVIDLIEPEAANVPPTELAAMLHLYMQSNGIELRHNSDNAMYVPKLKRIHMPNVSDFSSEAGYTHTLAHECIHSALRDGVSEIAVEIQDYAKRKGLKEYGVEELVAELGAAFLVGHFGHSLEGLRHTEYLNMWLGNLRADSGLIFKAAKWAQKGADVIMERIESARKAAENTKAA